MKKGDIAAIILVAVISAGAAYWIASSTIGSPSNDAEKVKTISLIEPDVKSQPSTFIFNNQAINPTVDVSIGADKK